MAYNNQKILAAGELLWDILPKGKQCGGAPGNVVYHALLHGMSAMLCSAVGQDALGNELLETIREKGLSADFITKNELPTGTVTVSLQNGHPEYTIHQPAAWDKIIVTDAVRKFAKEADVFCFGSLAQRSAVSRESIRLIADLMPSKAKKVFDVNLRQDFYSREMMEESLNIATILKISDEELPVLRKLLQLSEDLKTALQELLKRFTLESVIYTMGAKGSICCTEDEWIQEPVFSAGPATDTVGCGDSFLASFISAVLSGFSIKEAMHHASVIAGMTAVRNGAMPSDPAFIEASRNYSLKPISKG